MKVYESDYLIQRGSGCRRGGRCSTGDYYVQRGSGLGSIFSNIFKRLIPLGAKLFNFGRKAAQHPVGQQVIKAAKRTALDAGLNLAGDVLEGKNLKQSVKSRLKEAGTKLPENVASELRGGKRRKKSSKKKGKKKITSSSKKKKKKKKKTKAKKSTNKKKRKRAGSTPSGKRGKKKKMKKRKLTAKLVTKKKKKIASRRMGGNNYILSNYL